MLKVTKVKGGTLSYIVAGTSDPGNQFVDWLKGQLQERGWKGAELARRAGVSAPAIVQIMGRTKNLGPEVARKIAAALDMSPSILFQIAGILPDRDDKDELGNRLLFEFDQLDHEKQLEAIAVVRAIRKEATKNRLQGRTRQGKERGSHH